MRLVAAAQADHIDISVIDIFKTPKLSDLAVKCKVAETGTATERAIEPFQLLEPLSQSQTLDELSEQCRVSKEKIRDAYPTSPLQEALITLSIKQPGAYVAQHILELSSSVDITKFKAAWASATLEIDILRTRIAQTSSGQLLQIVLADDPIKWHEASNLKEAKEVATRIPSHLGGQLAAYTIVRGRSNEHFFIWTLHHALFDGWSIPSMLQRVEQIYRDGSSAMSKVPYNKFIKYLVDMNSEASTKFWKEHLANTTFFQFPQQSHSASNQTPNGRVLQYTAKLASSRHRDMTSSTIIRAAWALLLAAYTGSEDVIFGEVLTGRDIPVSGITEVCGPTLTTVPTRIKIDQKQTILDLLRTISDSATDRIPHQHLGLSEIKRIDQDTAAACDFQNLLAIQTGNEQPSESMWKFHDNGMQTNYFTYPLVLECKASQTSIDILAHYDENTISSWQTQRILYQFESILSQLNSVSNICDIQVFSAQDLELVREWNKAEPILVEDTMHSLFLKQVSLRPSASAISAFDGEFTYSELRDEASRLAHALIELGVAPGVFVPLCLDKSRWAVVAMLGVMMAGGAYVPLSPEHPSSRHEQIIQNCNATILLCSPNYETRFTGVVSKVVAVCESSIRQLPPQQRQIPARAKSSDICYVLYTSGSTGVPKGVVIEHRAIASSSAAMCEALYIDETSRVFQFASFVFDVSVLEILTALSCGATVCIPSDQERTTDITSAINKLRATWTCLTPSVANVIESPAAVPTLRTFASAAEALTPETIKKWNSGLQLLNAYGPTEGSVIALSNDLEKQCDPTIIGRVLQSGRSWIVHPENPHQLAPVSAVGELCIEGPLLARGYLHNPTKTSEVFIKSPAFMKALSSTAMNTTIYRTGDLVRYAENGSIHYLGRKDNQIKLAGQRIELGEIEHHVQAHRSVRQAIVILPKSGPGKKKLTAAVSLHSNPAGTTSRQSWNTPLGGPEVMARTNETKDELSDLVPSYMVPTVWVVVPEIPTLASAKIDRKQITAWFDSMDDQTYHKILEMESNNEPIVHANKTTEKLQQIWAKVLNLPIGNVKLNKSWLGTFHHIIYLPFANVVNSSWWRFYHCHAIACSLQERGH